MADEDLEEIRAKRMAELKGQYPGGTGNQGQSREQQEEMMRKQEEMKNSILAQILDQPARARLNTVALTKPEKARMVESMLIQMAQRGQIQGKLGEEQLKEFLEKVSTQTQKTPTVKQRKPYDAERMSFVVDRIKRHADVQQGEKDDTAGIYHYKEFDRRRAGMDSDEDDL